MSRTASAEDANAPLHRVAVWAVESLAPPEARAVTTARRVPDDGIIRIMRERRRAGTMSVVTGLNTAEIDEIAKQLKRHCGTGGTAKNGVVEIQGDHRERIAAWFAAQGRKAKLAGG